MNNDTIRVGVIGAGKIARERHIPGFKAIEGVEIVGVANRTRESSQRVADELQIPKVYEGWADLIADSEIDAVCIGTWPYLHRTLVLAALEQEKHVLVEARFSMDAGQAHEMLEASRAKPHLVTHVVPAPFTLQADQTIKDLLDEGYVGDLLSVDVNVQRGLLRRDSPFEWRHDRDLSGYNIMLLGAWYESLIRWLPPATSLTAITRVVVPTRLDASGERHVCTIPDHVEILCEMGPTTIAHMGFSEAAGAAPPNQVWLYGSEGTLRAEVDVIAKQCQLSGSRVGDRELREIEIPLEKQGRWRVEEEFVSAIRGKERVSRTTFEDGVRYMEFTEATTRSAQTRTTVYLPL